MEHTKIDQFELGRQVGYRAGLREKSATDPGISFYEQGWIRVAEHMPPADVDVLIVTRNKKGFRSIDKGYRLGDRIVHRGTAEVTHWMDLPMLPSPDEVE